MAKRLHLNVYSPLFMNSLRKMDGPANLVQIDFFPCFSAQELSRLREENAKMKEENGALIRVISKLSKPT
ncbi:uncharacterized protein DEA37_0000617 [Paragonimus westermani]|uniref:cGMP-dependent protein kinase interacting domain-containing protein n=1 Tax=Paragonimus westermani TaxID=34504 RepID=A0A5J4P1L0_9TREM|nr:uncharacterized protein DEA37_0000617 [Paragonimus westermani]